VKIGGGPQPASLLKDQVIKVNWDALRHGVFVGTSQ
jgi:hypothetical protein